jgi:hypothetical protein
MTSIEFLKPTALKLVLALVFFFLLISVLNFWGSLCAPLDISDLGGPGLITDTRSFAMGYRRHPLPATMGYRCGYFISYPLLLISESNILVSFVWAACVIVSYFLSCLTLLIAHKLTNQKGK